MSFCPKRLGISNAFQYKESLGSMVFSPHPFINKDFDLTKKDVRGPHLRAKCVMNYLMNLATTSDAMPPGVSKISELTFAQNDCVL